MDKRFIVFVTLAMAILLLNAFIANWLSPPAQQPAVPVAEEAARPAQQVAATPAEQPTEPERPDEGQPAEAGVPAEGSALAMEPQPQQWLTLGSIDPASPYRMLIVLNNTGAVVEQIELNDGFRDLNVNDPSGYLGPLAETDAPQAKGAAVQVVGPGTPAATARFADGSVGLQQGDVIASFDGQPVTRAEDLQSFLQKTRPDQTVRLGVTRGKRSLGEAQVALTHRPLKVVSRERRADGLFDPASLRLTLRQIGDDRMGTDGAEIQGVNLLGGRWKVEHADDSTAEFSMLLPSRHLKVVKRYRLASNASPDTDAAGASLAPSPNYHVDLDIELYNLDREHEVLAAYQLDGPTGLPVEGWWHASKIGASGARDVAVWFNGNSPAFISCLDIANDKFDKTRRDTPLIYMGVDAQYFSAILIPRKRDAAEAWFDDAQPIAVGPIPEEKARKKLTNTSCRLITKPVSLKPSAQGDGPSLTQTYRLFTGPKKPSILSWYQLDGLVYYGWPIWGQVSMVLRHVLHFFYSLVGNYALAIVMLTVLVRGCMFPISRKQALGAQKMQELQPEVKKINEKYKNNMEQRNKATQELFRKHKYNPLSGCLPMFLQLPIFIGLYRGLMLDVELRQAPLIPGLAWCSNLAAPDMLFRWDGFLPGFLASETGWLGPFFNLLPVVTVGLFLWQQKMFLPPPADEQAALQQKMMQYMMIFMAVMFFKVASGLCIYFIASSLWGIAERKLLPRKAAAPAAVPSGGAVSTETGEGVIAKLRDWVTGNGNGNGSADKRKRQRGNK